MDENMKNECIKGSLCINTLLFSRASEFTRLLVNKTGWNNVNCLLKLVDERLLFCYLKESICGADAESEYILLPREPEGVDMMQHLALRLNVELIIALTSYTDNAKMIFGAGGTGCLPVDNTYIITVRRR